MALKQITAKDFKDAVSSLTNGYTCWHKLLGRTDAGTELVFVIGWSDAGYDEDDAKQNGYADGRYTICSKIACQSRYNGSQSDYDGDFEMPYDKETGDVWDTDTMVSNNESDWETDAATYNKDAQAIWDTYCVPDEDGFTALDALFESKKSSEAKKHTCSMQKKKESLAKKKSESDYGAFDWTVGVSYLENGTGESVKDVYLIKAHNMNSAKEQAILRANRKGSDAHVYSCKLGKHIYGEAKKPVCSMQKKKESLAKKTEMVRPEDPDELKVGKYTADVLTADGDFILSLPAFYDDVAETVKAAKDYLQGESDYVKDTGLVPSKIHVTTVVAKRGWNMPQFVKDVDLNAAEAKKSEAYGDFNISDEDVKLTVNYVDVDSHGGSFSVDTPKDGQSYSLQEMKDMVKGMCEDCSGYADISRDGSDILIMVMAPETDENGEFANDYYAAYTVRCTVRIISTSLETFVDYLDKYNAE